MHTQTQGFVYSNNKEVCTPTPGYAYSNNKYTHTHIGISQCILITSKYAHTQGSVYFNAKQVHRDQFILATSKYTHTQRSNNKQVYTYRDQCIIIKSKYPHTVISVVYYNEQVLRHTGIK